jgi:uncharacterized protein YodC (DUF2158 family)
MAKFNLGTKVRLISGGPVMTVSGVDQLGFIICFWFDKSPQTYSFPENVLSEVEDDDEPMGFRMG